MLCYGGQPPTACDKLNSSANTRPNIFCMPDNILNCQMKTRPYAHTCRALRYTRQSIPASRRRNFPTTIRPTTRRLPIPYTYRTLHLVLLCFEVAGDPTRRTPVIITKYHALIRNTTHGEQIHRLAIAVSNHALIAV